MKYLVIGLLLSLFSNSAISNVINCNWQGGGQIIVDESTRNAVLITEGKMHNTWYRVSRNLDGKGMNIFAHHAEFLDLALDFNGSDGKTAIKYPYSFTAVFSDNDEFLGKGGCFSDEYPIF